MAEFLQLVLGSAERLGRSRSDFMLEAACRQAEDVLLDQTYFALDAERFAAFQAVSLDNHPIHYDVEYCQALGHPGPLAHGLQVLCFTAAGAGLFGQRHKAGPVEAELLQAGERCRSHGVRIDGQIAPKLMGLYAAAALVTSRISRVPSSRSDFWRDE